MSKFNSKKDVDRHVKQNLSKLPEKERNLRGYIIGKFYFKCGDFSSAQHWITSFLSEKDDQPEAYKLLGQCFEKLNKPDRAVTAYQRSLQLNSKQTGLISDVCRLILSDDQLLSNQSKAKYWCDLADTENMKDDNVLTLKMKLLNKDKKSDNKQVEDLIMKEITSNPTDVGLRIRLVKFFLEEKRVQDAFQYCFDIEMKFLEEFLQNLEWYSVISQVLIQTTNTDSWNYWCLLVLSQERQIYLNMKRDIGLFSTKQNRIKEITNLLFDFDQTLKKASDSLMVLAPGKEMVDEFIKHFRGQLCLHVASLLLLKHKISNNNQWRETTKKCLPLLFLAFQSETVNEDGFWLKNTNEKIRALFSFLKKDGAFRCAQAGRTILSCIQDNVDNPVLAQIRQVTNSRNWTSIDDLVNQVKQICADGNWRKSIYRQIFINSDQQSKISNSFFVQCSHFNEPNYDNLSMDELQTMEEIAQHLYPSCLEHQVYLGLGRNNLAEYKSQSFNNLNLSSGNLLNCNPETLNQIDIDSFLYCTILQAKRILEADKSVQEQFSNKPSDKPIILPAPLIQDKLCSEEQADWWLAAWKIYKNISGDNLAQLKATLIFGIEAVRGVDNPKVDLIIMLKLGDILLKRSKICDRVEERKHIEMRAKQVFKFSLKMIRNKDKDNLRRLFKFVTTNFDVDREVTKLAEDAITYLAGIYFKKEEYKELIDDFNGLNLPFASYFQAEAYRKLDDSSKTPKKTKKIYIEKAKELLHETMDLLESTDDKNHPLHSLIQSEMKRLNFNNSTVGEDAFDTTGTVEDDLFQECFSSSFRGRRDVSFSNRSSEIENLLRRLMENLSLMKEDVLFVRNDMSDMKDKLEKIEEILAKKSTSSDVGLNDMYMLDEMNPNNYLGANFLYDGRTQTPIQGAAAQLPQQVRTPAQQAYMMNTAYPMYPYQNQQMQAIRPGQPPKIPGIASPLQYPEFTNDYQSNLLMNQQYSHLQNLQMFQAAAQGTPQKTMMGQQQPTPKSYLMDALSTPSLLNTWNNTYNNITPQPVQQQVSTPIIPPQQQLVEKQPPVNVVITSSDPLPTHTTISQPFMSVTIPAQHIKHNNVQVSAIVQPSVTEPVLPIESAKKPEIPKTVSEITSFEPMADFKPIVQLPEVPLVTGEEKEEELFSERVKLYRFNNKEWKERGVGNIKIMKNSSEQKVRILMRQEQTQKICANHQISIDLKLNSNTDTTFIWSAPDFADGEVVVEKFQVKFKTSDIAKKFAEKFEEAKKFLATGKIADAKQTKSGKDTQKEAVKEIPKTKEAEKPKVTFGSSTPVQNKTETTGSTPKTFSFGTPSSTAAAPSLFGLKPKEPEKEKEPAKPSPFANFSFGKSSETVEAPTKSFSEIFSGLGKSPVAPIKAGTVGIPPEETTANRSLSESHEDDYVPTANFEPVIPLPELVDVKTGEENEDIVFEHRAKLLRFDSSTKEWKERGIGPMKVLVDKNDPTKARLLMRREQVFKLCCNQLITPELKFTKLPKSETALSWAGPDFSENEIKTELLAIRFKTPDLVKEFHEAVLKVQEGMKKTSKKEPEKVPAKKAEVKGFGDKFKPKVGSWECNGCYVNNKADDLYCVACETPKDNTVPKKEPKGLLDNLKSSAGKFSFGMPAANATPPAPAPVTTTPSAEAPKVTFGSGNTGFTFGSQPGGFTFGSTPITATTSVPAETTSTLPKPVESKITFGATPDSTTSTTKPSTGFTFGSGSFSFGAKPESTSTPAVEPTTNFSFETPTKTDKKEEDAKYPFGSTQKESFNFIFKPKSPSAKSPGRSANNSVSEDQPSDSEYHVEEENQAYFTPVIPLPDKIDVKTGEEDESVLYSHRAKLFRFVDGEWKERGLGDVKILKHNASGKLRVVMRREQVLKICLNHILTKEIQYKKKDDKSWMFVAIDYSEGVTETTQFCIRFKNTEVAKEFREAIDSALENSTEVKVGKDSQESDEDKNLIQRLKLPENFFEYRSAKECTGCRGCKPDEFVFPLYTKHFMQIDKNPLPLMHPKLNIPVIPKKQTKNVSFQLDYENKENDRVKTLFSGTADTKTETKPFGLQKSPESANIFTQSKTVFGPSSNIFGGSGASNSIFSPSLNTIPVSASTPSTADSTKSEMTTIFGGVGAKDNASDGGNIFGGKSTFSFGSGSTNIFGGALNKDAGDAKPAFGGTIFGNAATAPAAPVFGSNSIASTFNFAQAANELKSEGNIFKTASSTFGNLAANQTTDKKDDKVIVPDFLQKESTLSFATLASGSTPEKGFLDSKENTPKAGGFYGLTIKEDIFTKLAKQKDGEDGTNEGDESGANENYDPHYDPIIALPDEIQVRTGEEDETKLFGERAKLFRYDTTNKEWKERGVGEIKLLYHPQNETYRLLLRREQVHKLVLNQLITDDFTMKQMNNSGKAYCWTGMNYSDDEMVAEQLAVRFKNEDLAQQFKVEVDKCVEKIIEMKNSESHTE